MRFLNLLTSSILTCVLVSTGGTQPPPEIVQRVKRATALVEVKSQGQSGSAFCIAESGFFVTNAHVIEDAGPKEKIALILLPAEKNQRVVQAEVVRIDKDSDLALLKVLQPGSLTALELGDSDSLVETMPVTAFGYPFGKDLAEKQDEYPGVTVSTGRITALRKSAGVLQRLQLDASLNPGNSGGPVVDNKGRVVGVVESGLVGAGLNFAIPVSRLAPFLNKPEIVLEPMTLPYAKRSEPQEFRIRATSFLQPLKNPDVSLTLTEAGREPRTLKAVPGENSTFIVTASPLSPGKETSLLKVTFQSDGSPVACQVKDQDFSIGGQTVRLSKVAWIETANGQTTVELTEGRRLAGRMTGLEAVETRIGGAVATLNLNKVSRLAVEKAAAQTDRVAYEVMVQQEGKLLATQTGNLIFEGAPGGAAGGSEEGGALPPGARVGNYVRNPANDHWYCAVRLEAGISWTAARAAAEKMRYMGKKGHLVTLTTPQENQFVKNSLQEAIKGEFWLGGYQDTNASEYSEPYDGWRWVTGERWRFEDWNFVTGEPNNAGGNENVLAFGPHGSWNDERGEGNKGGYLVEFE